MKIRPRDILFAIVTKHDYATHRAMTAGTTDEATRWWKVRSALWIAYNIHCDKLGVN